MPVSWFLAYGWIAKYLSDKNAAVVFVSPPLGNVFVDAPRREHAKVGVDVAYVVKVNAALVRFDHHFVFFQTSDRPDPSIIGDFNRGIYELFPLIIILN